jgi:hypothetical protein
MLGLFNGKALADEAKKRNPAQRVLSMPGYSEEALSTLGMLYQGVSNQQALLKNRTAMGPFEASLRPHQQKPGTGKFIGFSAISRKSTFQLSYPHHQNV